MQRQVLFPITFDVVASLLKNGLSIEILDFLIFTITSKQKFLEGKYLS